MYCPIIKLRRKEVHDLPNLFEAFQTMEIRPFFEIIHPFATEYRSSKNSDKVIKNYQLCKILDQIPNNKECFVTIYRKLLKIHKATFADSEYLKYATVNPDDYEGELKKALVFKQVTPVFSVGEQGDLPSVNDFIDYCHENGRQMGLRLSNIDALSLGTVAKLTSKDFLFLDLGEDPIQTLLPSFSLYQKLQSKPILIILGENHNSSLPTKELADSECDNVTFHPDFFDDISAFPFITGAGDYCGLKNALTESRPTRQHPGFANAIFYQRKDKGYLVLRDEVEEGVAGFREIEAKARNHKQMIDAHAWNIINKFERGGDWSSWNVAGLVHYIYQLANYINDEEE